jgi:hypothetical protein
MVLTLLTVRSFKRVAALGWNEGVAVAVHSLQAFGYVAERDEVTSTYSPDGLAHGECSKCVASPLSQGQYEGGQGDKNPYRKCHPFLGHLGLAYRSIEIYHNLINSSQQKAAFHAVEEWCGAHAH